MASTSMKNGTVDRIYAGDLQGNLYRFDISDTTAGNWSNASNREIIFKASYGAGAKAKVQSITRRPVVLRHPDRPGHIVVFSTGSWMTRDDANNKDIQSIYGIWDDGSSRQVKRSDLVEQSFTNSGQQNFTSPAGETLTFTLRTLTNNAVAWDTKKGWHIDLDVPTAGAKSGAAEFPGERAVRNLQLRRRLFAGQLGHSQKPGGLQLRPGRF